MYSKKTPDSVTQPSKKSPQSRHSTPLSLSLITLALSQSLMLGNASAATLVVNDSGDAGTGCTLRDAVTAINLSGAPLGGCSNNSLEGFGSNDQIQFSVANVNLSNGELQLQKNVRIDGGATGVTINGNNTFRLINASTPGIQITLENLTLSGGSAAAPGGGAVLLSGDSLSSSSMSIKNSTVSGNGSSSSGGAIFVRNNASVSISDSVISNNTANSSGWGGGLYIGGSSSLSMNNTEALNNAAYKGSGITLRNQAQATISDSVISGNTASSSSGGVYVFSQSSATISNSSITNNHATSGAGMLIAFSSAHISNSTLSGNTATISAGGIRTYDAQIDVSNTTISGNVADISAGLRTNNNGYATLTNTTLFGNISTNAGTGALTVGPNTTIALQNSIVAGSTGLDCLTFNPGILNADSTNIIEDGSCTSTALAVDPKLAPLANNGGPTQTHALLAGSPAIDAGDNAVCAAPPVNGLDQRGHKRPEGNACDIGAYEFEPATFFFIPIPGSNTATIFSL